MLERMKIEDLVQLHSQQKCSQYVVFMGEALMNFFYKIQVQPVRSGKGGPIIFQKADQLAKALPESQKREYCQQIAFFYIRIFQIYAALALSVLDEAGGPLGAAAIATGRGPQVLGARPMVGGGPKNDFYNDIRNHMSFNNDKIPPQFQNSYIRLKQLNDDYKVLFSVDDIVVIYKSVITYKLSYNITKNDIHNYTLNITDFFVYNGKTFVNNITFLGLSNKDIATNFNTFDVIINPTIDIKSDFNEYFKNGFNNYYSIIRNDTPPGLLKQATYQGYPAQPFQRQGLTAQPFQRQGYPAQPFQRQGYPLQAGPTAASPLTDPREMSRFIDAFKSGKQRLQPYCVARALQLLKSDVLKGPAYTSICSTSYREASVPAHDGEISRSLGISALATLFYDMLESGGQLGQTANARSQYIQFMKYMATLFNDTATIDYSKPSRDILYGIKARTPTDCKTIKGDAAVTDKDAIGIAMKQIQEMFKIQIAHAAAAQKIIMKLFERTKDGSIFLTSQATNGGIAYLNKVADEARDLLTKYYVACEGNYAIAAHHLSQQIKPI